MLGSGYVAAAATYIPVRGQIYHKMTLSGFVYKACCIMTAKSWLLHDISLNATHSWGHFNWKKATEITSTPMKFYLFIFVGMFLYLLSGPPCGCSNLAASMSSSTPSGALGRLMLLDFRIGRLLSHGILGFCNFKEIRVTGWNQC